jgi:Spy/CpxP family protein refolding chaperone
MRNRFLVGLGLALSVSGAAAAQQPGHDSTHAKREQDGSRARDSRRGPEGLLLRGITLSDAQKAQLQSMRQADRAKFEANRDQAKKRFEEFRSARERGDTVAARAIMQRNRADMEKARDDRLAAVRNVLTAEQRVQFDKNVAELKERMAKRGDGSGFRRGKFGRSTR